MSGIIWFRPASDRLVAEAIVGDGSASRRPGSRHATGFRVSSGGFQPARLPAGRRAPGFAAVALAIALGAAAGIADARAAVDFNRDIRPLLADRCYACHGPDAGTLKGDLRLDLRDQAIAPAKSGAAAIVPGHPDQSELVHRIFTADEDDRMPPAEAHKDLSAEERETLRQWIAEGAEYADHWAFLPVADPAPPEVGDPAWNAHAIDRFVRAAQTQRGLVPSPEADRTTLIRRVSLDLRGLPPTLGEIDAFLADHEAGAYERMVDAMLASPHFGERMAMLWMDLARYGDTNGYHFDSDRPVWLWRDWVIDAYNRNMPFDEFTVWQLAGDLLPDASVDHRIASGFNRNTRFNEEGGADPEEFLTSYANDRTVTLGRIWLGLTLNCAECHSHKYDPVSQKEYYQLTAFFNSLEEVGAGGVSGFHGKPVPPVMRVMTPAMQEERAAASHRAESLERAIAGQVAAAVTAYRDPAPDGTRAGPSESLAAWEAELAAWQPAAAPPAASTWDFAAGAAADTTGSLGGELQGGAQLTPDGLALDGRSAHVVTSPLSADLRAKTLEAWVRLSNLDQRGGAVMTVQSLDPDPGRQVFDAIVFGEREPRHWMPGSDYLKRTDNFGGAPETEAATAFVHVAIAYDEDGTVRGYRNGRPYGRPIKTSGPVTFAAGQSRIVFGARALPPGGNFMLAGHLRQARLHTRALSEEEIAACAGDQPPPAPAAVMMAARTAVADRTPEQAALLRDHYLRRVHAPTVQALAAPRAELESLRARIAFLSDETNHPMQMVSVELPEPREAFVLLRGDFQTRGERVERDVPAFLPAFPAGQSRDRLGLARWIMRTDQPLVARVQVNRLWHLLFGEGIVRTLGDFGQQGAYPSHPELLDWLARRFIESNWDVKHTLRLILHSHAYRQASNDTRRHADQDPMNTLLWRAPRVRLPAESIRDNALHAAGLLSAEIGGPPVFPPQPEDYYKGKNNSWRWNVSAGDDRYRRGLYTFWRRTTPYPSFVIFDAPDRAECTFERPRTNTPLQALVTLNDPQFVEAARVLAQRVLAEAPREIDDRLAFAFRLVLARAPDAHEQRILKELLAEQTAVFAADQTAAAALAASGPAPRPDTLDVVEHAAWTALANALLNLDETITRP